MATERENVEVWIGDVRIKPAGSGAIYISLTNQDSEGDVYADPAEIAAAVAFVTGAAVQEKTP